MVCSAPVAVFKRNGILALYIKLTYKVSGWYLTGLRRITGLRMLSSKELHDWGQKEKIDFTIEQLFLPLGGLVNV